MTKLPPATPSSMAHLREWAKEHARHGSQPWQLVCDLFAEYDRRGQIIGRLTAGTTTTPAEADGRPGESIDTYGE